MNQSVWGLIGSFGEIFWESMGYLKKLLPEVL